MDEKKSRIKETAREVFLQNGYKNTNIAEIAKRSGMAVGSFYKYYDSKEDIFLEVYFSENEEVRERIIRSIDWDARIEHVLEQFFSALSANILKNNILREWYNPSVSDKIRENYRAQAASGQSSFRRFITETLTEKMEQKGLSSQTIAKTLKVMELIYYMDNHMTGKEIEDYEETLRTLVEYFIKGIFA